MFRTFIFDSNNKFLVKGDITIDDGTSNIVVLQSDSNDLNSLRVNGNAKITSNVYALNRLGVGTSNPTERVDVIDNIKGSSNIYVLGNVSISHSNPTERLDIVGNAKVSSNIYISNRVGINTSNPAVGLEVNTTDAVLISKGTTVQRPSVPLLGHVRYNTETSQFEGFGAGSAWGSLGGVKSTDQQTYVSAEEHPTSNDGNIRFVNSNIESMRITHNRLVGINTSNPTERVDIIGNTKISSNVYILNRAGINTSNPLVGLEVNTTDAVLISKGTTSQRPVVPVLGHIRYNTEISTFEGFGSGSVWGSLGGVKDTNQDTYISSESYPTSNDDNIRFINSNIESMRITNARLVGINTSNPTERLDVVGNIKTSSNLYVMSNIGVNTSNTTEKLDIVGNVKVSSNIYVMSKVGINTSNPAVGLEVNTTDAILVSKGTTSQRPSAPILGHIRYNTDLSTYEGFGSGNAWGSLGGVKDTNQDTYISVETYPTSNDDNIRFINSNNESMRITNTQLVGINTINPTERLEVVGNIKATSNLYVSNNIGVGTSNPQSPLEVVGDVKTTTITTSNISTSNITSSNIRTCNLDVNTITASNIITSNLVIVNSNISTNNVTAEDTIVSSNIYTSNLYTSRRLGVGTTDPQSSFEVQGTAYISGATILSNSVNVTGPMTLCNSLNVSGATVLSNVFTTYSGPSTFSNNVIVSGVTSLSNSLNVSGPVSMSNTMKVAGAALMSNDLTVFGKTTLCNQTNLYGATTMSNTLTVTGATVLSNVLLTYNGTTTHSNAMIVSGITTLSNNLNVSGPMTLCNTMNVSGATLLSNTLLAYGQTTLSNNVTISGPTTLSNTINVSGAALFSNGVTVYNGTSTFSNNAIISGNVGVGVGVPTEKLQVFGGKIYTDQQYLGNSNDSVIMPTFSFKEDSNTGMFHPSNDAIGFSTSGTEKVRINSNGQVGIGTSSPSEMLDVSSNAKIGSNLYVVSRLGVNTSNPQYTLDVNGTVNASTFVGATITSLSNLGLFGSNTAVSASNTTISLSNYVYGTNTTNITNAQTTANWASNAGLFGSNTSVSSSNTVISLSNFVYGNNSTNISWTSNAATFGSNTSVWTSNNMFNKAGGIISGNTTIQGTTGLSNTITLYASSTTNGATMVINSTSGAGGRDYRIISTLSANAGGSGAFQIYDQTASTSRLHIDSNGNIGIGTTTPSYKLDVSGDINFTGVFRQNGVPYIGSQWSNNSSNIFIFGSNIGIGTSNAVEDITVIGGKVYCDTQILGSTNDSSNVPSFSFREDSNTGLYHPSNDTLGFVAGGIETFRITPGQFTINSTLDVASNLNVGSNIIAGGSLTMVNRLAIASLKINRKQGLDVNVTSTKVLGFSNAFNGIILDVGSNAPASNQSMRVTWSNNTELMRLTGDGKLGVGTSNPSSTLDVSGVITGQNVLALGSVSQSNMRMPPIPMTSNTLIYQGTTYTVSSSTGGVGNAYQAFDSNSANVWEPVNGGYTSGVWNGSVVSTTTVGSSNYSGHWLQIDVVSNLVLNELLLYPKVGTVFDPKDLYVVGSVDNTNFTLLNSFTNLVMTSNAYRSYNINTSLGSYRYYRLIAASTQGSGNVSLNEVLFKGGVAQYSAPTLSLWDVTKPVFNIGYTRTASFTYIQNSNTDIQRIYDNGRTYFASNVGIGTTTPIHSLEVNGSVIVASNNTYISMNADNANAPFGMVKKSGVSPSFAFTSNFLNTTTANSMRFEMVSGTHLSNISIETPVELMRLTNSGSLGVGTGSPQFKVDVNNGDLVIRNGANAGNAGGAINFGIAANSNAAPMANIKGVLANLDTSGNTLAGGITFNVRSNVTPAGGANATSFTEAMRITPVGNVGIGNTNPGYPLQVNGIIHTTSNVYANNGQTNTPQIGTIGSTGDRFILFNGSGSAYPYSLGISTNTMWYSVPTNAQHQWYIAGSVGMTLSNNFLGINTTSPTERLNVNGNILASGNITAYSDARAKSNLEVITNPLTKVSQLNGYTYEMIENPDLTTKITPRFTGIIAQELEKVLPEAVHKDNEGKYSVAYGNMAGLFVESIKELTKENTELKQKVMTLEDRLSKLEEFMSSMV
jgi:hypothetical protein